MELKEQASLTSRTLCNCKEISILRTAALRANFFTKELTLTEFVSPIFMG